MYEHPYFTYRATVFEQERAAEAAERRRVLAESADRIRPRPGVIARMLRAIAARRADARSVDARTAAAGVHADADRVEPVHADAEREEAAAGKAGNAAVASAEVAALPMAERCPAGRDCAAVAA